MVISPCGNLDRPGGAQLGYVCVALWLQVSSEDAIEGMAYYIALYLSRAPEARYMEPKQLQAALRQTMTVSLLQCCVLRIHTFCCVGTFAQSVWHVGRFLCDGDGVALATRSVESSESNRCRQPCVASHCPVCVLLVSIRVQAIRRSRYRVIWDWGRCFYRWGAVSYSALQLYEHPWLVRAVVAGVWASSKMAFGVLF